ncbi:hypothetical protein GZH46_00087 [Fragariocoptes setiger]|uniref:Ig-like domain-containing protein n=1 Tax=Fragariocoptes setiger TaxID=1670756 RepID=A0ABQ7SD70_9ACAR|nr:hypothetical protein GZH46_00087 [Fragariocoptes setiger]
MLASITNSLLLILPLFMLSSIDCLCNWPITSNIIDAPKGQSLILRCPIDESKAQTVIGWKLNNRLRKVNNRWPIQLSRSQSKRYRSLSLGAVPKLWRLLSRSRHSSEPASQVLDDFVIADRAIVVIENVTDADAGCYTCYYRQSWYENLKNGATLWLSNAIIPFQELPFDMHCMVIPAIECIIKSSFVVKPFFDSTIQIMSTISNDNNRRAIVSSVASKNGEILHISSNNKNIDSIKQDDDGVLLLGSNRFVSLPEQRFDSRKKVSLLTSYTQRMTNWFVNIWKYKLFILITLLSVQIVVILITLIMYAIDDARLLVPRLFGR